MHPAQRQYQERCGVITMRRKLKGIIKEAYLKKMLQSGDYKSHSMEKGVYTITTRKSKFEIVPISIIYYNVFQIG